jgi:hypothetical protein
VHKESPFAPVFITFCTNGPKMFQKPFTGLPLKKAKPLPAIA